MKKRSFALSTEGFTKLEDLRELKQHKTLAETLRYCVDFAYDRLLLDTEALASDELHNVVKKNNVLLRVLLIEIIKGHDGQAQTLSQSARSYLRNLQTDIKRYMENNNIEVEE